MGVYPAKAMVMGCLLANILAISGAEEGGLAVATDTYRDDVVAPYCQFKGACFWDPSTTQAQFVESEPATDDQTQTVAACNGSGERSAPQHGHRKALGRSTMMSV